MRTVDFSETIAASDLKVSRSRHLIEYMKVCEYFMTLAQGRVHTKNQTGFSQKTTVPIRTRFFIRAFRYKEMKIK